MAMDRQVGSSSACGADRVGRSPPLVEGAAGDGTRSPVTASCAVEAGRAPGRYPVTPDGRYFVVRGRLWRCSDPSLPAPERTALTRALMAARRAKGVAMRAGDAAGRAAAKAMIEEAKVALGERGPAWWTDGAPDYNRAMAADTPYAPWWAALQAGG